METPETEGPRGRPGGEGALGVAFTPRLVDSVVDALVITDATGLILYANEALGRLLGYDVAKLFGTPFELLVREERREEFEERREQFFDAEHTAGIGPERIRARCADGSEKPVDIAFSLVDPGDGPKLLIAILWDVSDRLDAEAFRQISHELLTFLAGATGTVNDVVPELLAILAAAMGFELATAWRWDDDAQLLRCEHVWQSPDAASLGMAGESLGMTVASGEGLPGLVVSGGEALWVRELAGAASFKRQPTMRRDGLRSGFVFPIRTRGRLFGVVELFTRSDLQPDPPLAAAVSDLGSRLGEFIERLMLEEQRNRLLAEVEQARRRQDFLLRANQALVSAVDYPDTVRRLASIAVPTLGDVCLIDVTSIDDSGLVRMAAQHADPARQPLVDKLLGHPPDLGSEHPAARALRTGATQWGPAMPEDFMRSTTKDDEHFEVTQDLGFESYLSVPLHSADRVLGSLTVVSAGSGRQLGEAERSLAEELATQVASVVDRARSADEQLTIAHTLQQSLLPQRLDTVEGLVAAARYIPASRLAEVGGDFYDLVALRDGKVALVIGDVEGHDMVAATSMGQLRSAIRAYLRLTERPGEVLEMLDDFAAGQGGRLATVALAVVDLSTGQLVVASAGHPPPLLVSGDGDVGVVALRAGAMIGVGGIRCVESTSALEPGETIFFYTDGLVEDREGGADARLDRLVEVLGAARGSDLGRLCDTVLELVLDEVAEDDLAVLAASRPLAVDR